MKVEFEVEDGILDEVVRQSLLQAAELNYWEYNAHLNDNVPLDDDVEYLKQLKDDLSAAVRMYKYFTAPSDWYKVEKYGG